MEHREVATYDYAAKCTCGFFSMGIAEDPALFSDHLMDVSKAAGII